MDSKARAKVSANMIISDFSNIRIPQKQGQDDDSTLISPTLFSPTIQNHLENKYDSRSEVSRSSNNTARRAKVNPAMILGESEDSRYRRQNTSFYESSRKVFYGSNADAAHNYVRSDVSWGSDPGQNINTKKSILKSNDEISHQYNHENTNEWDTSRPLKVKTKSFVDDSNYRNDAFSHNIQHQLNPRYKTRSPHGTHQTWSDVTYRQAEARTELSNRSDPGPPGHLLKRRTSDHVLSRVPDSIDEHGIFDSNHQPITKSQQNEEDQDQEELRELMSLSSDPKIQRKFLDLRISNKSLMSINATLTAKVEDQSNKIANLTSFESIVVSQQQQLDHIIKIEELLRVMSNKISEQDSDIKSLKCQIGEASEEKQKNSVNNLFMNVIYVAYDDVTVLFTVITSLLYTIYIFPVIVLAKSANRLAEKSRAKIQEITG
ncbi:45757_t:CDS:2 [Gigaspora margarita]|uniref:45757_t:CDS:1 n=1 Tax=Gigaspora margarita TaxID=4874 RepID=A0ABN7VKI1_GIGMA|nr:45757_t:CDS:2 [Gigaspora margarita]